MELEIWHPEHTDDVIYAHAASECSGPPCTVHAMSDHHMRAWPQHWRRDRGLTERICPHGIGHPDPDEYLVRLRAANGIHGCDGCCIAPKEAA